MTTSFEDLVLQYTITDNGLRPAWAGNILAALGHADGWGRGGGLTPEELGILSCIKHRVQERADQPADDSLEYAATRGLLGWVLQSPWTIPGSPSASRSSANWSPGSSVPFATTTWARGHDRGRQKLPDMVGELNRNVMPVINALESA